MNIISITTFTYIYTGVTFYLKFPEQETKLSIQMIRNGR